MATAQGLLILLVAAAIVSTTHGACFYVVDVQTYVSTKGLTDRNGGIIFPDTTGFKAQFTVHDSAPSNPDTGLMFSVTKGPVNFAKDIKCALYQFLVIDWNVGSVCRNPCRLTLQLAETESLLDQWTPESIRIRGYNDRNDDIVEQNFDEIPPHTVVNGRNTVFNKCG